jgi:hypothetical protein
MASQTGLFRFDFDAVRQPQPESSAGAGGGSMQALISGSHTRPGAHASVESHAVRHTPLDSSQRYGKQRLDSPMLEIDSVPSSEQRAIAGTHSPSSQR